MVDLPLMAKLVTALQHDARLLLLGDKDQLASVEAGAVLGDLCGGDGLESFSTGFCELVQRVSGIDLLPTRGNVPDHRLTNTLVTLKKNYRFQSNSGIGVLALAVKAGDGDHAMTLLNSVVLPDISWSEVPEPASLKKALTQEITDGYHHYLTAQTVEEALSRFDSFRVLCALREGPHGVTGISALIEKTLAEKGLIDPRTHWYKGRPVLITVNDYTLKLFNGDVGIVFPDPEMSGQPRVFFSVADGGIRKISPVRLPAHETVFAMTVHRSQGSEFSSVLLLLPNHDSAALSQELLYTGISRAMKKIKIWGNQEIFIAASARKIRRTSGLSDAAWI
jgi:exodeoxyribonuclease V alpha subunit